MGTGTNSRKKIAVRTGWILVGPFLALVVSTSGWSQQIVEEPLATFGLGRFNTAEYSPDGNFIVSGGAAGAVAVWDAESGAFLRRFPACDSWVLAVAVSPDGTRLATSPWIHDTSIKVLNSLTGHVEFTFQGYQIRSLHFTPDDTRLIGAGGGVTIWDLATGQVITNWTFPGEGVYRAALSRDGTRLATGHLAGSVRVWDIATSQVLQTLAGHASRVNSVDFSADGSRLVTSSSEGTAKVWDLPTSRLLQTFTHDDAIYQASFSPDGTRVVTASFDKTAKVWDVSTGGLLLTLEGHNDWVLVARFSPDGSRILTGSVDNTVRIWDAETGELLRIDRGYEKAPYVAAFVPGSTKILAGSALWDTADGRYLRMFVEEYEEVRSGVVSPDGACIATGDSEGLVRLWDTDTGELLQSRTAHDGEVTDLDFAPDGVRLVTASADTKLKVWDLVTSQLLLTFTDHEDGATQVAWSPDGSRICSGDALGVLHMWDPATGSGFFHFPYPLRYSWPISSIDFSPDSRFVAVKEGASVRLLGALSGVDVWGYSGRNSHAAYPILFTPDGTRLLTMTSSSYDFDFGISDYLSGEYINIEESLFRGQPVYTFVVDYRPPAAFSPDSSRVLTGYATGRVALWDTQLPPGPEVTPYPTPTPSPTPVATPPLPPADTVTKPVQFCGLGSADVAALSGDGQTLVTGGTAAAFIWDVPTGLRIQELYGERSRISSLALDPQTNRVVTGTRNPVGPVALWDSISGEVLRRYASGASWGTQALAVAYSHDRRFLLAGFNDDRLVLWDVETTSPLRTFAGHGGNVNSVVFAPDDSLIASGSQDGTARLWDPATGELLKTFAGGRGAVYSVEFSPDGLTLLTASAGNVAQLWDTETSQTLVTYEGHTGAVRCAVFSPDGARVLTRSSDKTARLWDAATGELLQTFQHDPESVMAAGFRDDGTPYVITSAGAVQDLTLVNPETGGAIQSFRGHVAGSVYDVDVSPDGSQIASTLSHVENIALVWDAATGDRIGTLRGHNGLVGAIAYSPDGTHILTGSNDFTAKLWDAVTGTLRYVFQSVNERVLAVDFSPDGSIALIANELWDVDTGQLIRNLPFRKGNVLDAKYSPTGDTILITGGLITGGAVTLVDVPTGLPVASLRPSSITEQYRSAVYSPDGTLVAAGGLNSYPNDHQIVVWNPFTNEIVRTFNPPDQGYYFVAFSPDGTRLLAGGGRSLQQAWLWDLASGQLLRTFSGFSGIVYSVDFTPDGRYAVIGCGDGTVTLWNADTFVPSTRSFTFADSEASWSVVSASQFDPPGSDWRPGAAGGLILRAGNNTSTFGYWESPVVSLWGDMSTNPGSLSTNSAQVANQSVYTSEWLVRSSVTDRARVPQLRLRLTEENLQQSHFLAIESRADGAASPDADGESYSLVFSPAPGSSQARLAFDLLNFDSTDDPNGDLQLGGVTLSRRNPYDLAGRQLLRRYTFDESDEGWTQGTTSVFNPPTFGTEPGALTLSGTGGANAFGFWSSPSGDLPVPPVQSSAAQTPTDPDLLYIATFIVESDVPAASRATVPQFRLRLNEESFHAASVVAVESRGDGSRSPAAGEPQSYTVYYRPPAGVADQCLGAAFDFLNFDPTDNPTAALKLREVAVEALPWPW